MKFSRSFVITIYILLISSIFGTIVYCSSLLRNDNKYITFTQYWPHSICYRLSRKQRELPACYFVQREKWIIGGVWPSKFRNCMPIDINLNLVPTLNSTIIKELREEMNDKWVDITQKKDPYNHWKIEWKLYGSSFFNEANENDITSYFRMGLKFMEKYDMTKIFKEQGITPGKKWKLEEYRNAVRNKLNVVAQFNCIYNEINDDYYLEDVRLGIHQKDGTLFTCSHEGDCPKNKEIIYPSIHLTGICLTDINAQ